jgi:hypothetical protein
MTIAEQLEELAASCQGATWKQIGDGSQAITIPDVELPEGWSAEKTTVRFIVPVGYPVSRPDCFWADPSLRLKSGAVPANTGQNNLPDGPNPQLWFSWHVQRWSPNHDTLLTYFRAIKNRFREAR